MSLSDGRKRPSADSKKVRPAIIIKATILPLLLIGLIFFASSSTIMPEAKASPGIIYSDSSDGEVNPGGESTVVFYFVVGDYYYNVRVQSFVKFSLTGISGTLASARLYLYVFRSYKDDVEDLTSPLTNPGLGDCLVRHIADYGTLGAGDLDAPSIGNDPGVLIPGSGAGSTPNIGYVSIDIRAAMQDDIDHGRAWSAFMIKLATDTDNDGRNDYWLFYASEQTGTSQDPYVEYTFAPLHWTQVNANGFDDANNAWVGSWHEFKGQIYIGLNNFYTGIEVCSSSDGVNWNQVGGDGFGDPNNVFLEDFEQFQCELYASIETAGPPQVARIFRSSDGISWHQIGSDGLGDVTNYFARLYSFGSYLTAFTGNAITGMEIWTWDGSSWTQRMTNGIDGDANNVESLPVGEFNGYLYISTANSVSGAELWRSSNGVDWAQVNNDGFDGDSHNIYVQSMQEFNGYLYAATYNDATGFELWRSFTGTSWSRVGGDGFGDNYNYRGRLIVFKYELYLIADNWDWTPSPSVPATGVEVWRSSDGTTWSQVNADGFNGDQYNRSGYPIVGGDYLYVATRNDATGAEVWRSSDGTTWSQVNDDGFGDSNNNGPWARFVFKNRLYVASDNDVTGVEVWRLDEPVLASLFHPHTEFWFTWYDKLDTEICNIHFVNTGTSTATIYVYIAGPQVDSFTLGAGLSTYRNYAVNNGPVHIVSDQPLWVTKRVVGWGGFKEVYGLPGDVASTDVYYTWYDYASPGVTTAEIYLTNPNAHVPATAQIYISGSLMDTVTLVPGESRHETFLGIINGPVRIMSDQPIYSTQLVIGWSDFDEIVGTPSWYVSNEHYFTWYDSVGASIDNIHIVNPSAYRIATINIYIAGVLRTTTPITLAPETTVYRNYPGVIGGPVRIVSDQPIRVTQRIVGWGGFKEVFSVPAELLASSYYFTWYDWASPPVTWDALHFMNPSATQTAHITVRIGGIVMGTPLTLAPGQADYRTFQGIINGPILITSDIPIMATQRILGWSSFEETIGMQWT